MMFREIGPPETKTGPARHKQDRPSNYLHGSSYVRRKPAGSIFVKAAVGRRP